jgi:serine/threonine-protein kinase HipA
MADIEVHLDLDGSPERIGLLRLQVGRGVETVTFEYDAGWLKRPERFSIEPALTLSPGSFTAPGKRAIPGSIGDSAPDSWGRRLMQRAERRAAKRDGRAVRTLTESAYLLGVSDETRMGALRFRRLRDDAFQAPLEDGVPTLVALGKLVRASERILRDDESDEDFRLLFAPGSSLGGARPKASVIDQHGRLAIAKFPKETDGYSIETWEEIALRLADRAGIVTADHRLIEAVGKAVLISRRFDRADGKRIPFLSAMSMLDMADGERGSYPEIVDALVRHGSQATADAEQLYRRMVLNVLISNVDDHLRNHGFLWRGRNGWSLSPAYDVNPTPTDEKARVLSTNIDLDEGTCSLDLVLEAASYFNLKAIDARTIVGEVGSAVARWRDVAAEVGAPVREIERMASAFEHDDLARARTL